MDVRVGDKLVMKKNHPCGCNTFDVCARAWTLKSNAKNAAMRSWFHALRQRKTFAE